MTSSAITSQRTHTRTSPAAPTRRALRGAVPVRGPGARFAAYLTLLVLWGVSISGPVAQTLTMDRRKAVEGVKFTITQAVVDAWWVAFLVPAGITLFLLVFRVMFVRRDLTPLVVVLLPSLWIVLDEFSHGRPVSEKVLLPIGIAITLWALQVRVADLRLYALLTAAMAVASLALTSIAPRLVYMPESFDLATDKALLNVPLLAGFFSHPNGNGLFLAFALPLTYLFSRWYLRWSTTAVLVAAILWSASRTALFGVAVWFVVVALAMLLRRSLRAVIGVLLFGLCVAVMVVPLTTTDPAAYTLRGAIWQFTLSKLSGTHWLDGLGHSWFTENYDTLKDALTTAAGHGHNVFVTYTVTGGLILVATFAFVVYRCARIADGLPRRESIAALGFLCVLAGLSITETAWRVEAPDDLLAAMLIPLFVIATQSSALAPLHGGRTGERSGDSLTALTLPAPQRSPRRRA